MPRTGGHLTRARIVKRAAEMFRKRCFHSVSVGDILKACGISKGTFYFYFDSKQALAEQVIDYYAQYVPAVIRKCFAGVSWREGVDNFVNHFAGSRRKPMPFGTPLANLGLEVAYRNPILLERIARVLRSSEEHLAAVLEAGGMAREEALRRAGSAVAALEGHLMRLTLTRDARFVRRAAAIIKNIGDRPAARPSKDCSGPENTAAEAVKKSTEFPLDIIDDWSIIQQSEGSQATRNGACGKRHDILRCAAEQFGRGGYHATTVEEILDACGVPKGSFHFYFAGKRDLAAAVLACYRVRCCSLIEYALSRKSWPEVVDVLCDAAAGSQMNPWRIGCPLGNMGMELAGAERGFAGVVGSIFQILEDKFAGRLREFGLGASRARENAAHAVAFWQGHITRMIIYGDVEVAGHLREDLLDLVC